MMLKALPLVHFWSILLLKEQMMTSVGKTLRTLVWSAQNRSISSEICPKNNHKMSRFLLIAFWQSLPRKFPWNSREIGRFFLQLVPKNPMTFSVTYCIRSPEYKTFTTLSTYYMFVNDVVFSLVYSFLAWCKHLSPCMGASQPLHIGKFCTLKKQVEMIFMGLSGRCPLSPHMQHSFLCPLIPSTCYASYSNLLHVPYFIQIKATKNFKFDSTQFVNLIEAGFKPDTENWPSRRHAFP